MQKGDNSVRQGEILPEPGEEAEIIRHTQPEAQNIAFGSSELFECFVQDASFVTRDKKELDSLFQVFLRFLLRSALGNHVKTWTRRNPYLTFLFQSSRQRHLERHWFHHPIPFSNCGTLAGSHYRLLVSRL